MENIQGLLNYPQTFLVKLAELQGTPSLDKADRSIVKQAHVTLAALYNPLIRSHIDSFLKDLDQSPSVMKHRYAAIVREKEVFEQISFNKIARIFEMLELSSINQITAAFSYPQQNYAQIDAYVKKARAAFDSCRELFSEFEELFPKEHPLYADFIRIHTSNREELLFVQQEVEHAFDIAINIVVFHKKSETSALNLLSQLRSSLNKILIHSLEELHLLNQTHGMTKTPIEQHLATLNKVTSLVTNSPTPNRAEIHSLIRRLDCLQKAEPKFTENYAELQALLLSQPLQATPILEKSVQLEGQLVTKIQKLILKYKVLATDPVQQVYKTEQKELRVHRDLSPILFKGSALPQSTYTSKENVKDA